MLKPDYTYKARPIRVVDADTIWVRVDLGFRMWAEVPVRLVGVNAPERYTTEGRAATRFTSDWLNARLDLVIATAKHPEKYGRWLARVQSSADGQFLNDELINAGHATAT